MVFLVHFKMPMCYATSQNEKLQIHSIEMLSPRSSWNTRVAQSCRLKEKDFAALALSSGSQTDQ